MRIGIDATSLLTKHPRGEGRSLLRLYEEIHRVRPMWQFIFFGQVVSSSAQLIASRVPNSQTILFDPPGFRWNTWENLALPLRAWLEKVNVLHCSSSGAPIWSRVPVVMTVHDLVPVLFEDGLSASARRQFDRRLKAGCRVARRIICVSENTRNDLLRRCPNIKTPPVVIPWGSDYQVQERKAGSATDGALILGLGGGGARRKNLPMLVRSFSFVARKIPSAKLRLVGVTDPDQRRELESLAGSLGLQSNLEIYGFVPDEMLADFYRTAGCVVYVSLYEGFGLPVLEAMSYGTPVVASNTTSIPEVVGDAGLLVDPYNAQEIAMAILRIMQDADLSHHLRQRSLARARQFSWHAAAVSTAEQLEHAAGIRP